MAVVVVFEIIEFSHQVERIPERGMIKVFTSDGANNPFDEFCAGTYEFGAQATAVALTAAVSASAATDGSSTSRSTRSDDAILIGGYHKGAAVFTVTKGGVFYEASIVGQKFSTKC